MQNPSEQVKRGLKDLANEKVEPFHYERTMARVRSKIERRNPMVFAIKKTAVASGVVVALFAALLLIPASYSVCVGDLIKAEFTLKDEASLSSIMDAIKEIEGVLNRNLNIRNDKAELSLVTRNRSSKEVELELRNALSSVLTSESNLSISSEEIKKLMGGNALAAVTGGRICIGVEGMTDQQIEALIAFELNSRGLEIQSVNVKTDRSDEGQIRREVRVLAELPEGVSPEDMPELLPELMIDDSNKDKIIIRKEIRK